MRGHHVVVDLAVYFNAALKPVKDYPNQAVFVSAHPVGGIDGGESSRRAFSISLMAACAITVVNSGPKGFVNFHKVVFDRVWGSDMGQSFPLFHTCQLGGAKIFPVPFEHDSPYLSLPGIRHIQGSVRSHRQAHGPELRITYVLDGVDSGKAVGKYLPVSGLAVFKRNKGHKITGLRIGTAVGGAMKGNKCSVFVPGRKLITLVKIEIVRRPVSGETHDRIRTVRASADFG